MLAPGGCGPSAHYRLRLGASAGGVIVVRGLRIFLEDGSGEMEVFPHRRPQAATTAGATFGSSIGNLVATDRVIDPPDDPFDAARGWHSGPVGRGQWAPVEITFPDDATLGSVRAATGHTGGVHAPNRLRIERRLPGGTFQPVTEKPIQGTQSIAFQPARAKVWRLSFRAGATGFVVVRGLRFFDAEGEELFPALGSFD